MKRLILWVVSGIVFVCDCMADLTRKWTSAKARPRQTVLVYHDVREEERAAFARQMRILAREKRAKHVESLLTSPDTTPGVWVTFDDAYEGVFRNAWASITEYSIPVVVFVPAAWLGKLPGWKNHFGAGRGKSNVATAEMLRAHAGGLMTYGSHGVQHLSLMEAEEADVRQEILESKRELEQLLQRPVKFYAFAYGHYGEEHINLCRQAGYSAVFSALPRWKLMDSSGFLIHRTSVSPKDWPSEFFLKVRGAYRWHGELVHLKRKIMDRVRRRRLLSRVASRPVSSGQSI